MLTISSLEGNEAEIMVDPLQEIDWNEAWKNQMKESRGRCPSRDCARIWESREIALG